MSDHQQDIRSDFETAPTDCDREFSKVTALDLLELDFSRLERARASLDGAFGER